MSGTQIWIGRKPCSRSLLRCALTLSRDDLDGDRARNFHLENWLHVTYHNFLPTSSHQADMTHAYQPYRLRSHNTEQLSTCI
jgi:hypothetical protein